MTARRSDRIRRALVAVVLLIVVGVQLTLLARSTTTPTSTAPETVGDVRVRVLTVLDGDTVDVESAGRRERVRLIGLDAPEMSPPECLAAQSREHLVALIAARPVRLEADRTQADRDVYGRLLRHVVLSDGRVAAESVIAAGYASEYTYDEPYRYRDRFLTAQAAAKRKGLGIWGPECGSATAVAGAATEGTASASKRTTTVARQTTKPGPPPAPADAVCLIKGNIAKDGERIYHVPGQRYYEATIITESKGERWFCTEADAVAAGWRMAKV